MNIEFYSKTHIATDEIKEYVTEKLERINNHIPREATNARVHVDEDTSMHSGEKFSCEITVHVPGKDFHSATKGFAVNEAIDLSLHKIKRQAEKYKSQTQKNHR